MEVEFMWKDADSRAGGCPSISRVTKGSEGYVIVGKQVDAATRAQIPEVADDEVAAFVPARPAHAGVIRTA